MVGVHLVDPERAQAPPQFPLAALAADQRFPCQPFVLGDLPSGGNAQARTTLASGETTRLKAK